MLGAWFSMSHSLLGSVGDKYSCSSRQLGEILRAALLHLGEHKAQLVREMNIRNVRIKLTEDNGAWELAAKRSWVNSVNAFRDQLDKNVG